MFELLPPLAAALLAYFCGARLGLRVGLAAILALMASIQIGMGFSEFPNFEIGFATLPPWWLGRQISARGKLVRALAERNGELKAEEDAFVRLSVRRERARIARELHDIVAHHLAVMVVQAGAGRMATGGDRDATSERFATIRHAGGQALAEMARLVDVLHADSGESPPGLGRFQVLVDQADAGGLEVTFTPPAEDVEIAPEAEDGAFRVVQEGLTNVIKHAPGAEVHVRLVVEDHDLEVEVNDGGGGASSGLAATGSGLGLEGMRERIEALGGTLDAGPRPGGGGSLRAILPGR
jgi:signal transduction histidine kinase